MSVTIKFRRGNSAEWTSNGNVILASGEPGYELDTGRLKIGNGITTWNNLQYASIIPSGFISGTGINISLGSNGSTATINCTGSGVLSDQSKSIVTTAFNKTANTINKGSVVYINGGQGDQPTIQLAIANTESGSSKTYGITAENITSMNTGKVVVFGALSGFNTDQFNPTAPQGDVNGTTLYLSPTVSGSMTTTKPSAPNHMVSVGTIIRTHQNEGIIEVRIQNGFELEELHNVAVTGATNGQLLQYNSGSGLWVPSSSGNFTNLTVNGTGVSLIGHTHTSNDITNFNSVVSGLLPTITNSGDNRILTSTGSTVGVNAESNLIFDGTTFICSGDAKIGGSGSQYLEVYNGIISIKQHTGSFIANFEEYILYDANGAIASLEFGHRSLNDSSGNSTLFWGTPGKIGINRSIPTYTLDVNGSGNFASGLFVSNLPVSVSGHSHTSTDIVNFNSSVSGLVSGIYQPLLTNPVTGTGTTNYISKWTSSSSQGNSIISDDGTTCTIGTAGLTRVQIVGIGGSNAVSEYFSTQSNPRWQIGRDLLGGGLAGIGFGIGTSTIAAGGVGIGYAASREMGFYTSNATSLVERMRINNVGNVGIGTNSPSYKLDVNGIIRSVGAYGVSIDGNGGGGPRLSIGTNANYAAYMEVGAYSNINNIDTKARDFRIHSTAIDPILYAEHDTGNIGIGTSIPSYKLQVNGSFGATTKSFRIDHPSKANYSLEYGSLESPYHGVRLTGRGTIVKGVCRVFLPSYLKDLIHDDETINIQLTNLKHGKTLYVSNIDLKNDQFIVKCDRAKTVGDLEFFWTFSGVRKDVDRLVVEKPKEV